MTALPLVAFLLLAAPPADEVPLDGLTHVALRVADITAARDFYMKLGLEPAFEFSDAKGVSTYYMKLNDRQYIELYRRKTDAEPLGLMHVCFDVPAIEPLYESYIARGLKPTELRTARAGNRLFNLKDPEGQTLEYTQYMPGSMHTKARGTFQSEVRVSTHLIRSAVTMKDIVAGRAFFTEKLGFKALDGARLALPGKSGEEIELEAAGPEWKPRLTFAVESVKAATAELKKRGFTPRKHGKGVAVVDPDGATLLFIE
jgi:catechol 2,3-dioxygenase-like lactoylglutathione lyase family enzyme